MRAPEFDQGYRNGVKHAVTPQGEGMHSRILLKMTSAGILFAISVAAFGAEAAPDKSSLTVEEALNVAGGLNQMTTFEIVDKDGKAAKGYYDFSADTRIVMAVNISIGRNVQSTFEKAVNDIRMRLSDGTGTVPEAKIGPFAQEVAAVMAAPSRAGFHRIPLASLCLKITPECKTANPIPAPALSLILPIVDR